MWCDASDSSHSYGRVAQRARCGFSVETLGDGPLRGLRLVSAHSFGMTKPRSPKPSRSLPQRYRRARADLLRGSLGFLRRQKRLKALFEFNCNCNFISPRDVESTARSAAAFKSNSTSFRHALMRAPCRVPRLLDRNEFELNWKKTYAERPGTGRKRKTRPEAAFFVHRQTSRRLSASTKAQSQD